MVVLYGWHACCAALLNENRVIKKVLLTLAAEDELRKDAGVREALSAPRLRNKIFRVQREELDKTLTAHQGIAIEAQALTHIPLETLHKSQQRNQIVLVLDQLTDPQNVGSMLRLCRVFGADAIVMTERHAPKESGAMAKVASGALETVARCVVTNLGSALRKLKDFGFWCVGLTEHANKSMRQIDLSGKIALIIGSEGSGMRQKTEGLCDFNAFLPTSKNFSTLNATTAAAIALYEVFVAQSGGDGGTQ
jgi:23S rRNA (guanosine2251-2'-O)-methyltransferase